LKWFLYICPLLLTALPVLGQYGTFQAPESYLAANYDALNNGRDNYESSKVPHLQTLLSLDCDASPQNVSRFSSEYNQFIEAASLKKSQGKNEEKLLESIYYKIHRKFLKKYKYLSRFSDLLKKGYYDCLTGTALYAATIDALGFDYEIIETNYHIFLIVHGKQGNYLMEATDPLRGFVAGANKISERVVIYQSGNLLTLEEAYAYPEPIYQPIGISEMTGLYYYNIAVSHYNNRSLFEALSALQQGIAIYDSERMKGLMVTILNEYVSTTTLLSENEQYALRKFKRFLKPRLWGAANSISPIIYV